jgi:hypothetical protein
LSSASAELKPPKEGYFYQFVGRERFMIGGQMRIFPNKDVAPLPGKMLNQAG